MSKIFHIFHVRILWFSLLWDIVDYALEVRLGGETGESCLFIHKVFFSLEFES